MIAETTSNCNPQTNFRLTEAAALRFAEGYGWYVFPVQSPIFNDAGECTGCTCEHYRRSDKCKRQNPRAYLGPTGKCAQPGKCPACKWADVSTIDPDQIRRCFGHTWEAVDVETGQRIRFVPNLGIDCGKSGLLVLDADTYKRTCGDLSDLLSWEDRQTVTAITGGGGEHLIYDRQNKPYGNSTRGLPPGIDIRGDGGYIVAFPSLHKSGRLYTFEEGYTPRDVPLLPIPDNLDTILAAATPKHARRFADAAPLTIPAKLRVSVRAVEQILKAGSFEHSGQLEYGNGVRWIFAECPFNPADDPHGEDGSAFVLVLDDGKIAAGCHHNRCQKRIEAAGQNGWHLLRQIVGKPARRAVMAEVTL